MGNLYLGADPETSFHVVSKSDHPIKLKDYGFIEEGGILESIPFALDVGALMKEGLYEYGSSNLKSRNDVWQTGYIRKKPVLGAYALSVTETRPTICFNYEVKWWTKLWVRIKIYKTGEYYI